MPSSRTQGPRGQDSQSIHFKSHLELTLLNEIPEDQIPPKMSIGNYAIWTTAQLDWLWRRKDPKSPPNPKIPINLSNPKIPQNSLQKYWRMSMPLGPRCGWTDRGLARVQQAQAGHHSRLAKALHACRRTKLGKQNSDFSIVHSIIFQGLVIDFGIEPWLQRIWRTKKRFEMVMEGEDLQKVWILCCFAKFHILKFCGQWVK